MKILKIYERDRKAKVFNPFRAKENLSIKSKEIEIYKAKLS